MFRLHARPLPFFRHQIASFSQSSCVLPVEITEGRGGGGGRGAEAYDRKKALPSINHSILAAPLHWHLCSCMKQINHILFVTEYSLSFSNANANGSKNVDTLFHYAEIIK
jgi:hypothetical protein